MDATREALRALSESAGIVCSKLRRDEYVHRDSERLATLARDLKAARAVLASQEPGGARTPQKTCSKCGHAWHQWDGRSMCDVDGGCLCGGDIPEPAPSPSPGEAPRELNSAERERISALLDAHERVVLLCEPPGCSQAEYDEAAGRMIHARDLMVAALRSAASPSPGEAPRPTCHACEIEDVTYGSRPREEHDPSADCRYAPPSSLRLATAMERLADPAADWEQAKADLRTVLTEPVNRPASPSAESDLDLLEDCWRQWSYTVDGHANHQDDPWAHDGGLSTLEALAERLTAAGRLERVSERPDKDWYRRPSALRRAGGTK